MRVVIADDHRIVREGLRWMLSKESGIEIVGEAASGGELLELLSSTDTDVVLLDVRMPEMNGLDALEHLQVTNPGVRVIVLSMHDEPAYVKRAIELGASGYLLKNTGREELIRALELVASGKAYVQGDITALLLQVVATPGGGGPVPRLSRRERQVLQLVAQGLENKQIAKELDISEATVKTYLRTIFSRFEVSGRSEAVAVGLRLGLID